MDLCVLTTRLYMSFIDCISAESLSALLPERDAEGLETCLYQPVPTGGVRNGF